MVDTLKVSYVLRGLFYFVAVFNWYDSEQFALNESILFEEYIGKSKIKLSRYRHAGTKGERSCRSYSFLTLEVDGMSGQGYAPAAL
jgi:hypothetical protein